jgi:hypothetical protein
MDDIKMEGGQIQRRKRTKEDRKMTKEERKWKNIKRESG